MKITKVEPILVDRYLFVQVHTDEGLVGLGESGAWGFLESAYAAVTKFGDYLLGEDPLRIEHHWQYMYRASHFRGADIMGALSAIDIALWDIAGQYRDVPGLRIARRQVREQGARLLARGRERPEKLVDGVQAAKEPGFTAVGPPDALPGRGPRRAVLQHPRGEDPARHRDRGPRTARRSATTSTSASRYTGG